MVVDDLDLARSERSPDKTDTVLVVNADAVLTFPVTTEGFEAVVWRCSEVGESCSSVELVELSASDRPKRLGASCACSFGGRTVEDVLGTAIGEGLNHANRL
jgi:hypothetical protein